ncbi:MAG TPA: aspartyl protease family protein [Rhizomicrobium sp.]|jgi:hypothetical protein|nr:aspartyl protease family protein [Rhizomicrobium sp.]
MTMLSRRTLIGSAAAGLALRAASAETAPPPQNIQASTDNSYRLTLDVAIGGKGPFRFLVDTGADRTVLATEVAAALGLPDAGPVIVQGITSAVPAQTALVPGLGFGSISLPPMAAPLLPRAALGADGYLGLDAIDGRAVTFDFVRHRLTIGEGAPVWLDPLHRPDEMLVRASGRAGKLVSGDCSVDGVHTTAFIDSGAEVSVGNSRLFAAMAEHTGKTYDSQTPIPLIGVTGGIAQGRPVTVNALKFGTFGMFEYVGGTILIADLPIFDIWGLANRPALLFGMNFLRGSSRFSIDYRRREFLFRMADLRVASRAGAA